MKAKIAITPPIMTKSIKPKPLESNFSDLNDFVFCIIIIKSHTTSCPA